MNLKLGFCRLDAIASVLGILLISGNIWLSKYLAKHSGEKE